MKLLIDLYKISSPSGREKDMIAFITAWLKQRHIRYSIDRFGNIYATKGNAKNYPCLVAHTDEVHQSKAKNFEVIKLRNDILFGYDRKRKCFKGIGADDKNGIWVCLKCLETFDRLKCVFFTGEETGCIGSRNADMSFFRNCRFVLQCDRRGNSDFITHISMTELCSAQFVKAVNPGGYGYKVAQGLQTDVLTLKERGLNVSCANISCGYYNPHTDEEYTNIADLQRCLRFVEHIIRKCTHISPHKFVPPVRRYFGSMEHHGAYGRYGWHNDLY